MLKREFLTFIQHYNGVDNYIPCRVFARRTQRNIQPNTKKIMNRLTKKELQEIIDKNLTDANEGCENSQMIVVNAQWLLDRIANQWG